MQALFAVDPSLSRRVWSTASATDFVVPGAGGVAYVDATSDGLWGAAWVPEAGEAKTGIISISLPTVAGDSYRITGVAPAAARVVAITDSLGAVTEGAVSGRGGYAVATRAAPVALSYLVGGAMIAAVPLAGLPVPPKPGAWLP
jgi:hypothetical protein